MKRRTFLKIGSSATVGGVLDACGGSHGDDHVPAPVETPDPASFGTVVAWNQLALQAVRTIKPGPPMVARSLAILHTAMYNAWAVFDRQADTTPQGPALRRPDAECSVTNKAMAMSYAAHAALADQFPTQKAAFDAHMASLGFDTAVLPTDDASPAGVGRLAAAAMINYCHTDGANQLGNLAQVGTPYADYTGYVASNPPLVVGAPTPAGAIPAPGHWQPLTYVDASGKLVTPAFLAAFWGRVAPFALGPASQWRPGPPAAFGSDEYVRQAQRLIELQVTLTERQKVIAEYWADGPSSETPAGHWALFAQFVSARDRHNDDQDVKLFFALANAVFDAGIAAWDAKRSYDSTRPITAIRYLMYGKIITGYGIQGPAAGLMPIAGESWVPFQPRAFPTPPFPEHVSGHSTFSAAAAEVLRLFTGSDRFGASYTKPARSMLIDPALPSADLTLEWPTFSAAAAEAGISRLYGGIHFDNANDAGLELGLKVGALAFAKAQQYWRGGA
jgi:hypothetical protein